MTNLVQKVPYKEDISSSNAECHPVTLLRPIQMESKKKNAAKSVIERQS